MNHSAITKSPVYILVKNVHDENHHIIDIANSVVVTSGQHWAVRIWARNQMFAVASDAAKAESSLVWSLKQKEALQALLARTKP